MTSKLSSILFAAAASLPIVAQAQKAPELQFFLGSQEWTEFSKVEAISPEDSKGKIGVVTIRTRDKVNIICNYGIISVDEEGKSDEEGKTSLFEVTAQHCRKDLSDKDDVLVTPTLETLLKSEGKGTSYQRKPDPLPLSAFELGKRAYPHGLLVSTFVSIPGRDGNFRDFKITGPTFSNKNGTFRMNLSEKDYNRLLDSTSQGALYGISGSIVRDPYGDAMGVIIESSRKDNLKYHIIIQPLVRPDGTIQIAE